MFQIILIWYHLLPSVDLGRQYEIFSLSAYIINFKKLLRYFA